VEPAHAITEAEASADADETLDTAVEPPVSAEATAQSRDETQPATATTSTSGSLPGSLRRVEGAGRRGERWILPQNQGLHIGRGDTCFVQLLDDGKASRQHARLSYVLGGLYIEDLSSANGTSVNGDALGTEPRKLEVGDRVQIGDTVLEAGI
jgi:pSer/pThr/pTyr-binding forkhead associated (FHA) protein